jgi:hypothetical protein
MNCIHRDDNITHMTIKSRWSNTFMLHQAV